MVMVDQAGIFNLKSLKEFEQNILRDFAASTFQTSEVGQLECWFKPVHFRLPQLSAYRLLLLTNFIVIYLLI